MAAIIRELEVLGPAPLIQDEDFDEVSARFERSKRFSRPGCLACYDHHEHTGLYVYWLMEAEALFNIYLDQGLDPAVMYGHFTFGKVLMNESELLAVWWLTQRHISASMGVIFRALPKRYVRDTLAR